MVMSLDCNKEANSMRSLRHPHTHDFSFALTSPLMLAVSELFVCLYVCSLSLSLSLHISHFLIGNSYLIVTIKVPLSENHFLYSHRITIIKCMNIYLNHHSIELAKNYYSAKLNKSFYPCLKV